MLSFSAMAVTVYPLGLAADLLGTPLLFGLLGIVVFTCMLVAVIVNPGFIFGRVSATPVMATPLKNIGQPGFSNAVPTKSSFMQNSSINPVILPRAVQQSSVVTSRTISQQRDSRLGGISTQVTYGLGKISPEKKTDLMRGTRIGNYGLGNISNGGATNISYRENLSVDGSEENSETEPFFQSTFDEVIQESKPDDDNARATENSSQYRPDIDTEALKNFFAVQNQPNRWRKMFVAGCGAAAITAGVMRLYERSDQ
jgi:hypothetical protein